MRRGLVDEDRLVGEEHDRAGRVPAAERPRKVGAVPGGPTGHVVDPGEVERGPRVADLHPLVAQRPHPERPQLLDPLLRALAGVVLVVAGDEVRPVPGLQVAERGGQVAELLNRAVDEVPDDRDHVRLELIDHADDAPGVADPGEGAEVDVAHRGDP